MSTCTHPIREGQGYSENFSIIGTCNEDAWGTCKTCGAWWWCIIDTGKFQFEDQRLLPTDLAEKAILHHDPKALAELFVGMNLPHGPVWEFASALVSIFRQLTPNSTDADRARAIEAEKPTGYWAEAARTLAQEAAAKPSAPDVPFQFDLRVPNVQFGEWFEVGEALVILSAKPELFRLEKKGLVHLPLSSQAKFLARGDDRLMLAVPPGIIVMDAAGQATSWPLASPYEVSALDGGWWLFVPETKDDQDRAIEFHKPDGRGHVKLPRRFFGDSSFMPPPRRFAGGWIVSNLVDDDGKVQALTLFDADFKTVAYSTGIDGVRQVTPIDDESFWASIDGTMERWVRRDKSLDRAQTFASRSSFIVGDTLITDAPDGEVIGRGMDGRYRWSWKRSTNGATYGVAGLDCVLLYDDDRAHWLGSDGKLRDSFSVESADVAVGREKTIYVKSRAELFLISETMRSIVVGLDARLETTSGDAALVKTPKEWLVVGHEGVKGRFEAPGASYSVVGTRGLWVVERNRIRGIFP